MHQVALSLALLLHAPFPAPQRATPANPGPAARTAPTASRQVVAPQPRFQAGIAGFVYGELSEPGLKGTTFGGSIVFSARPSRRFSIQVEGGRARFYGGGQEGHRDFFFSGLLGVHVTDTPGGLVLLAGPGIVHSERHKFFGELATNKAALTVGADWIFLAGERLSIAASWRTDIASGIMLLRPGISFRARF